MKKVLNYLKKNRLPIPICLGQLIAKIPYSKRPGLGKLYKEQSEVINDFCNYSISKQEEYIFEKFKKIFTHAFQNVKFYNDLYTKFKITPDDLKSFSDIQKVPIISKNDLLNWNLEERSFPIPNRLIVNTGGSSGKALSFYMDPGRYGNEWAHVHDMWSKFQFKPTDLKLSFDGRAKENNKIVYDFARNSLLYDIYADPKILAVQLKKIVANYPVKYLHGYPSAIYEFAIYCEKDVELLNLMRKNLIAAFLSSEYPSPHYRNKIEGVFGIKTQSFYGHTETCVLAVESEKFVYDTYQTYGYAEAVKNGDKYDLIGTSFFNFASPLIRYNTADLIEPLNEKESILSKFIIREGRSGEFILDKYGKKVLLTGLIYGRHHELFNVSEHIQVYQKQQGEATIFYVSKKDLNPEKASEYFNADGIDIDFYFIKIEKPYLTSSGKANLLIKNI